MKLAIIGTGISGMVTAYLLCRDHDITVFEANDYVGGHTHTHAVEQAGRTYHVDTGFIVFNERTYPNFCKLLKRLGVESQASDMSFSVRNERTGLEYKGSSLNTLFAQRRNLFRPAFYRMLLDALRFRREAPALLHGESSDRTLEAYLREGDYSRSFIEDFIVPMGAAIWSADPRQMLQFPARFFIQFFENHGFLDLRNQPQWRTIRGGSWEYVKALTAPLRERIQLRTPVREVRRFEDRVEVTPVGRPAQTFDACIIAAHSDQALRMLADASDDERAILGAIPYQSNDTVLHTDAGLLPRRRRAWASWNYHVPPTPMQAVTLSYNMNMLQRLDSPEPFCVTLNRTPDIDGRRVLRRLSYDHPVFTPSGVASQGRREQINGARRTYFCGAYWGYGFHEDGVNSALAVCKHFGKSL